MNVPRWLEPKVLVDEDGCWLWQGAAQPNGYCRSSFKNNRVKEMAHRLIYKRLVGEIPDGLDLDHTCHTRDCKGGKTDKHRRCVNPEHLKPATRSENSKRGNTGRNGTTCEHGVNPKRLCGECNRERIKRWREEQRTKNAPVPVPASTRVAVSGA